MKYITKEVRIGIAGIAALCILVYGINYLKGINMFKPSSYFYVKFQNVNGLTNPARSLPTASAWVLSATCTTTIPNRAKSLPK